jgi:hypothetical protein
LNYKGKNPETTIYKNFKKNIWLCCKQYWVIYNWF